MLVNTGKWSHQYHKIQATRITQPLPLFSLKHIQSQQAQRGYVQSSRESIQGSVWKIQEKDHTKDKHLGHKGSQDKRLYTTKKEQYNMLKNASN